jgi:hypothetical protein
MASKPKHDNMTETELYDLNMHAWAKQLQPERPIEV